MGAMGAALLLGRHHLAVSRALGSAVVRAVVEVDGAIHRLGRKVPPILPSEAAGDGLLDPAEREVPDEPSRGAVGVPPTALGSSARDRRAKDGGSEQQVGGIGEGQGGTIGGERSSGWKGARQARRDGPYDHRGSAAAIGFGGTEGISLSAEPSSLRSQDRRRGVWARHRLVSCVPPLNAGFHPLEGGDNQPSSQGWMSGYWPSWLLNDTTASTELPLQHEAPLETTVA